ncbi:hypothetical protein AAVH_28835 [Aphelenchoides avenae]|nr:hypothetical protein AAVH_28835 [Aphelenchus avenae]
MLPTALIVAGLVAAVNGAAIQLGDGVGGSAIVVSANGSDLILTLKGANANHIVPLDVTEKTETPSTPVPTTVPTTMTSTDKPTTERNNDTKQKTTTDGSSEESSESTDSSSKAATEPVTTPKPDSAVGNAPTFGLIALLVVSVRFF